MFLFERLVGTGDIFLRLVVRVMVVVLDDGSIVLSCIKDLGGTIAEFSLKEILIFSLDSVAEMCKILSLARVKSSVNVSGIATG